MGPLHFIEKKRVKKHPVRRPVRFGFPAAGSPRNGVDSWGVESWSKPSIFLFWGKGGKVHSLGGGRMILYWKKHMG